MVISFDSGTTNTKAFLFNGNGEMVASSSHPTPTYHRGPGMVEQNAEDWWKSMSIAAEKLYSGHGWSPGEIEAIGISSQGGTFVPLGMKNEPLRPAVTWLDNRGESEAEKISSGRDPDFFYKKTGHYIKGWSPPAAIRWIAQNEPSVRNSTARISFVADYLNYMLTGRFFIDPTSAQMSCLYNIRTGTWDSEIMDISCIGENNLPCLLGSNTVGGATGREVSEMLHLREGTPVVSGGHDQYCASIGVGADEKGDCLLSCGTAWVLLITSDRLLCLPGKGWTPGRHTAEGMFGLMASIGNSGIILEWMRNNLKIDRSEKPSETRVVVVPDFSRGAGSVSNISLSTTGTEIYRAAMESLVYRLKKRLEEVDAENPVKRLFMVGGATREPFLPDMVRKITKRDLLMPDITEAAGRGAAILAINRK